MKVWLIGAGSLLGPAIAKQLNAAGIPFFGTTRADVDVSSEKHVSEVLEGAEVTHLINCAAFTDVDACESQQALATMMNAEVPELLGQQASKFGVRVIHFSSDYVFDGSGALEWKEQQRTAPINAYGVSKLQGEQRLKKANPKCCIIRTSSLFGGMGKHFVTTMLKLMQTETRIDVVNDQISRPTYRQDLAKAAVRLLDTEGIYHYANAGAVTWHAFAEGIRAVALEAGIPLKVEQLRAVSSSDFPRAARRPSHSALCTEKCDKLLGPSRHWYEALGEYIERNHESFIDLTPQSTAL